MGYLVRDRHRQRSTFRQSNGLFSEDVSYKARTDLRIQFVSKWNSRAFAFWCMASIVQSMQWRPEQMGSLSLLSILGGKGHGVETNGLLALLHYHRHASALTIRYFRSQLLITPAGDCFVNDRAYCEKSLGLTKAMFAASRFTRQSALGSAQSGCTVRKGLWLQIRGPCFSTKYSYQKGIEQEDASKVPQPMHHHFEYLTLPHAFRQFLPNSKQNLVGLVGIW